MAFLKYANAVVAQPVVSFSVWDEVRSKALALGPAFTKQAAQTQLVLKKYDPNQYLLSHCTIMASVDTENGPGSLGHNFESGRTVNRTYQDYYITPDTAMWVNNNFDSWERKLLLATFRTFIGAYSFVEHIQIPELSKGRVIDAVARDTGKSVYIDILVANDLKHDPLIQAIKSGQLNTLSMGCSVLHTTCTKCGNVAQDETDMCTHIRYEKGNSFTDVMGRTRKIAELCGHYTDPESVKFIEASWVANPAFKGAVVRNILSPSEAALMKPQVQKTISLPGPAMDMGRPMAARTLGPARTRTLVRADGNFGGDQFEGAPDKAPKEEDPSQKTVDDLAESIRQKALEQVREDMNRKPEVPRADEQENRNENLIHQASQNPYWREIGKTIIAKVKDQTLGRRILLGLLLFKRGGWNAVREAQTFSSREVLAISRFLDEFDGTRIAGETRVYKTVLAVGGSAAYGDVEAFLAACRRVFGREITTSESDALITKGRLYDLGIS